MQQYVEIQHLIRTFNWYQPSWDLFIILFWVVASVLYAFTAGRGRILSILVSVYMAKLLVLEAPFLNGFVGQRLNVHTDYLQQLIAFGALFLVLFFFLSKYAFRSSADSKSPASLVFTIIFALTQIGLLINIVLSFLPETITKNLSPLIHYLFTQGQADFIWLVLPVAFLILLGRFVSHKSEI